MKRDLISIFVLLTIVVFFFSTISVLKPAFAVDYENQYHHIHIESEGAWAITQGLKNITVAIIDSGIDYSHPDLVNVAWINDDEIANNSIDDDGNGYIDDIYGWDFVSNDSVPGPELDDPIHWHATFIAGIIAAPKDDLGVVGVAPNITVMDVRVLKADNYAGTNTEGLGDAIKYAVDNGADVINMSLQYYPNASDYFDDIVYAISQNVPVISVTGNNFASGGQEIQSFPGGFDEVISVGATNHLKLKADYSNYGIWTEIVAPVGDADSVNIRSCVPPMDYWYGWGTSFACPQVAATVALMRSLNYSMPISELRYILQNSSTDLGDVGRDIYFGYGLLNASRAVRAVLDPSELLKRPPPGPEPTTPTTPPSTPVDTNYYLLVPIFVLIPIFLVIKWKKRK